MVIGDVFGVSPYIEDLTRRIAAAGYAAIAPDFYIIDGKKPDALKPEWIGNAMTFMRKIPPAAMGNPAIRDEEMGKIPEPDRSRIKETFEMLFSGANGYDAFIPALKSAVRYLRHERPESKGQKAGCVGFCMGGGLSALLACEENEISGAAIYYGSAPPAEKIPAINGPVIGFYGSTDQRINPDPAFAESMKAGGKEFEYTIYEGASHGFFKDDGPVYNVKAVRDSYAKLLDFFNRNLGS